MFIFPKFHFSNFRVVVFIVLFLLSVGAALYYEVSFWLVLLGIFICMLLVVVWALSRTLPRTSRYKKHISQFGLYCDTSDINFDMAVSAAIPFEASRVVTLVYWHNKGVIFGRKGCYRKLLFSDIDEVNEIEFMGNPIVQLRLKAGSWEEELFLPLDREYRNN